MINSFSVFYSNILHLCYYKHFLLGKKCQAPKSPDNSVQLSKGQTVEVGDFFEYDCIKGYILNGGNLRRACLPSGRLTGEPPNCIGMYFIFTACGNLTVTLYQKTEFVKSLCYIGEHSSPTVNFDVELHQRSRDGGADGAAYTALNEALRVHKNGRLVRWEFYSIYDGVLVVQVWRKSKSAGKKIR